MAPKAQSIAARYWRKVDRSGGESACWPWIGYKEPKMGYGRFWDGTYTSPGNPRMAQAHRWAYLHFIRDLLPDELVLHTCDNPPCQNPRHHFIGTTKDNAVDRQRKGRSANNIRHALAARGLTLKSEVSNG